MVALLCGLCALVLDTTLFHALSVPHRILIVSLLWLISTTESSDPNFLGAVLFSSLLLRPVIDVLRYERRYSRYIDRLARGCTWAAWLGLGIRSMNSDLAWHVFGLVLVVSLVIPLRSLFGSVLPCWMRTAPVNIFATETTTRPPIVPWFDWTPSQTIDWLKEHLNYWQVAYIQVFHRLEGRLLEHMGVEDWRATGLPVGDALRVHAAFQAIMQQQPSINEGIQRSWLEELDEKNRELSMTMTRRTTTPEYELPDATTQNAQRIMQERFGGALQLPELATAKAPPRSEPDNISPSFSSLPPPEPAFADMPPHIATIIQSKPELVQQVLASRQREMMQPIQETDDNETSALLPQAKDSYKSV